MAPRILIQLTFLLLTQYLVIVLSSPVKFVFDVEPPSREEKSLLNTFPFNQQETDHTTTRTHRDQTYGRQEKNVPQPFRNLLNINIIDSIKKIKSRTTIKLSYVLCYSYGSFIPNDKKETLDIQNR